MQYLGFDLNGRECELYVGDEFETHLPSLDQVVLRDGRVINAGNYIVRDPDGKLVVTSSIDAIMRGINNVHDQLHFAAASIGGQCALSSCKESREGRI